MTNINTKNKEIVPAIIGLGYVGLPLFVRLSKKFKSIGFDIKLKRINKLKKGIDENKEFTSKEILHNKNSIISSKKANLKKANFYIVCVPTPINKNFSPNLKCLEDAAKIISTVLKKGDIVFFESTVYPGVTETIGKQILEKKTKLKINKDFYIGYSPERINPGDKEHSVEKIKKIVAISTNNKDILYKTYKVYQSVTQSIIKSKSIRNAEAAKVIENIQRDLNIGLFNEIFKLCEKTNLNYQEVIDLASTKWNFHKYSYGLVGGHCLPVDPYYLAHFARKNKINLDIVLAGRKTNNDMVIFFIKYIKKKLIKEKIDIKKDKICFYGLTYKKNVPDFRNSLAIKIVEYFNNINNNIYIEDPYISKDKLKKLRFKKLKTTQQLKYLVVLVKHKEIYSLTKKNKNIKILDVFNN